MEGSVTYEQLVVLIQDLNKASSSGSREIEWCNENRSIGVSRDHMGRIEIFLKCGEIKPVTRLVRENLEYEEWFRVNGEGLFANRLLLPAVGYFDQVAAFLCTELIRNGGDLDLTGSFFRTEPVIELAIERLRISDNEFIGLCGEMLLLRELLLGAESSEVEMIVASWRGYKESSRDFQIGPVGVEVKSTTGLASLHHVSGVHQVEVGHGVDGQDESDLQLVSIGVQWLHTDDSAAFSLPTIVEAIMVRIQDLLGDKANLVCEDLKSKIAQYGDSKDVGYQHDLMGREGYFRRAFQLSFVRCYDMVDPRIGVLSTEDVAQKKNVDLDSVTFTVRLPDQVNGDVNPVLGLSSSARHILSLRP